MLEPVTRFTERRIIGGKWSSDGRRLLLKRLLEQVDSLWTMTADKTDPVRLTDFLPTSEPAKFVL